MNAIAALRHAGAMDPRERTDHISEDFKERVDALLGGPTYDPHGDPIPRRDGGVPPCVGVPLASIDVGERAVVRRTTDQDPEVLTYLPTHGLVPGAEVSVVARAPFDGPVTVQRGDDLAAEPLALANTMAASILAEIESGS